MHNESNKILLGNINRQHTKVPLNNLTNWHDVDWRVVTKEVAKLRSRIFKAAKERNFKQLRSLQKLMLSSNANVLYSIRRSTYSKGKYTAGIDGVTVVTPKDRIDLFRSISREGIKEFSPKPTRRIHLTKPDGSLRPIGIPTIKDRVIQRIVANALEPEWEAKFEPISFGFRPGRTINDAISYCRHILGQKARPWVLEVDVSKCFDSFTHSSILDPLEHFPAVDLIKKWLRAGILFDGVWLETPTGTPQGAVLSPLLSNIGLHGLAGELGMFQYPDGRFRSSNKYHLIRYADDMVIFARSEKDCVEASNLLDVILAKRGLKLNKVKTKITLAYEGFDFLGFRLSINSRFGRTNTMNYHVDNGVVYKTSPKEWFVATAEPSAKAMASIKTKLKDTVIRYGTAKCSVLISKLNPIIRGWANSKRYFYYYPHAKHLDYYLYVLLQRWAKRRHPNKGIYWRNAKYYSLVKNPAIGHRDKWTFRDIDTNLPLLKFYWFYEAVGKKVDWVRISNLWVPDDSSPEARLYFEKRRQHLFDNKLVNFTGERDRKIAKRQNLICPVCGEGLFNGEPLHRHHIIERQAGGLDVPSNIRFVHMPCHYRIHHGKKDEFTKILNFGIEGGTKQTDSVFSDGPVPLEMDGFILGGDASEA